MGDIWVADLEGDGLLPDVTKMWCFVTRKLGTDNFEVYLESDIWKLKAKLSSINVLVGHNFFGYDLPMLSHLYNIRYSYGSLMGQECKIIDSLALSRGLYPDRNGGHGLETWGERFGVPKPEIEDWEGLSIDEYIHRCTEDVKINELVYEELMKEYRGYES
jgi:DNA polymerase III alpha subunit (gram-positive type)